MKRSTKKVIISGFLAFILMMPTSAAIVRAQDRETPQKGVETLEEVVPSPAPNMKYYTVAPCRVLDTRYGTGISSNSNLFGPVFSGNTITFWTTEFCNVPYPEAKAVHVNIAAVYPTGPGFLTAYAHGTPRPQAAVLNFGNVFGLNAISNAVTVPICESFSRMT